jgi:hypothetical protein
MGHKIYAPNLHLFAFHLRKDSESNPSATGDELLWEKCHEIFDKFYINQRLHLREIARGIRADLLKEATDNNISLPLKGKVYLETNSELSLTGLACPLQIYDTSAIALNLRRPEKENGKATQSLNLTILSDFNPKINGLYCFLPEFFQSEIGQTLLLTAWLTKDKKWPHWKLFQNWKFLQGLADECLNNFISERDKRPEFYQSGQLFGSPIFEYRNPHILVWLFCDPETDRKFNDCYQEFIDLFCYRNKIIRRYQDSREVYSALTAEYHKIDDFIQQIPTDTDLSDYALQELKTKLKSLPKQGLEYSQLLRDLDEYDHTIEINRQNYEEKLNQIQRKLPEDDLTVLKSFSEHNCRLFQNQIKADLGYFKPGLGLLDNAISTIRGIAELEQTERDRNIDRNIAIFGFGIGAAGVVASGSASYAGVIQEISPVNNYVSFWQLNDAQANLVVTINFSLLAGAVASLITAGVIAAFKNRKFTQNSPKLPP